MPQTTDQTLEALIEESDGAWHEDVFHIGGPELMALLRRAAVPLVAEAPREPLHPNHRPDLRYVLSVLEKVTPVVKKDAALRGQVEASITGMRYIIKRTEEAAALPTSLAPMPEESEADQQQFIGDTMILSALISSECSNDQEREVLTRWIARADQQRADAQEVERLNGVLRAIGDFAHDHSSGPTVPDDMWEVRRMAYEAESEVSHLRTAPRPTLSDEHRQMLGEIEQEFVALPDLAAWIRRLQDRLREALASARADALLRELVVSIEEYEKVECIDVGRVRRKRRDAAFAKAQAYARGVLASDAPQPHPFKEWTGGGPVRPYCANCGRLRNDPLHTAGVTAHCADCNQPMGDHINGCPTYPPMGTPGVTCPAAAAGVALPANRCGYCGQDMLPGSGCTTSASADKCAIYREFAATRKVDAGVSASDSETDRAAMTSTTAKE
jgi:hypothetical protein